MSERITAPTNVLLVGLMPSRQAGTSGCYDAHQGDHVPAHIKDELLMTATFGFPPRNPIKG